MNTLYFPINIENLAFYYESAIIKPAGYISNRKEDVQSMFSEYLVLTQKPFSDSTNCSLELVFNEDEDKDIVKISENFYCFDKPLPISRVKKIFFKNKEEKENKMVDFKISSTANLQEKIIKVDSTSKALSEKELNEKLSSKLPKQDWSKAINSYNSILGGIALMRLGSSSYVGDYFSVLSVLNELFEDKGSRTKANNNLKMLIVPPDEHRNNDFYKLAYVKRIRKESLISLAEERNLMLKEFGNSIKLKGVPWGYFYLAIILSTYDEVYGTKTIANFIEHLGKGINGNSKFIEEKRYIIALYFGINKGYRAFRSKYEISNEVFNVKFQLDSKLDYYTIESCYQYAINNNLSNGQFSYLDSFCPSSGPYDNMLQVGKKKVGFGELSERYLDKIKGQTSSLLESLIVSMFEIIGNIFLKEEIGPLEDEINNLSGELEKKDSEIQKLNLELQNQKKELIKLRGREEELEEKLQLMETDFNSNEGSLGKGLSSPETEKDENVNLEDTEITKEIVSLDNDDNEVKGKLLTASSDNQVTEEKTGEKTEREKRREELAQLSEEELNELCKKHKITSKKRDTKIRNILKKEYKT